MFLEVIYVWPVKKQKKINNFIYQKISTNKTIIQKPNEAKSKTFLNSEILGTSNEALQSPVSVEWQAKAEKTFGFGPIYIINERCNRELIPCIISNFVAFLTQIMSAVWELRVEHVVIRRRSKRHLTFKVGIKP